jgi:hypothetical protein
MRFMAPVLTGMLAVCVADPAFAAKVRTGVQRSPGANPDRATYENSGSCGGGSCYRGSSQKSQKHMKHHKTS